MGSQLFPAELSTPAAARCFVVESMRSAGVDVGESVPVAVSELVTNSVLHVGGTTRVSLLIDEHRLRVEVHDDDPTLPVLRTPSPDTVTGRGLLLVEALTDRWGAVATGAGKVVWFELDR